MMLHHQELINLHNEMLNVVELDLMDFVDHARKIRRRRIN
jgi:hypothetical protein